MGSYKNAMLGQKVMEQIHIVTWETKNAMLEQKLMEQIHTVPWEATKMQFFNKK